MIDQATINRIMDVAEITEVIQDFVTLKKRGVNYLGLCPFHNEKTPSFTVSSSKGIYKCFGCGRGGNVVNFLMEHEHLSYPEALKYLARKYHIEIIEKEQTPEEVQLQNERESMMVLLSFAQKFFSETLFHDEEGISIGLSYFKERGFRQDTLKKFMIGYSPEQKDSFTQSAQKAGYKMEFLTKTGLSIQKENYVFDRFNGRVIFPIQSLSGQVIGFGGRILKTDARTAKYLNSPESEIYHKSRVLYGLFQGKQSIVSKEKCLLVEGYTDVLALHQAGLENVVASSGTALTPDQIRLIKRFTPNITILYDGDEAGLKASLRGVDLILEEGLNVKIVMLPEGEDPDSFSKKQSVSEFRDYLNKNEQDFIKFKTELLIREAENDPIQKAGLIRNIVSSIAVIPDSINRSVYLKECSRLMQIDEKVLYYESNKIRRNRTEKKYKQFKSLEEKLSPVVSQIPEGQLDGTTEAQELELIRLLLNYGDKMFMTVPLENKEEQKITVAEYIISELKNDELLFENPDYQLILEEYTKFYLNDSFPDQKYFINHPNAKIRDLSARMLGPTYDLSKIWKRHENYVASEEMKLKELVPETLYALKNKKILQATQELEEMLNEAQKQKDIEQIIKLQERIINLNKLKIELSKNLGDRAIL